MRSTSNSKGKYFEDKVGEKLNILAEKHGDRVRVTVQPRLTRHDGQEVIPDFEL